MGLVNRFQNAWNAFIGRDPTHRHGSYYGYGSSYRTDRPRLTRGNERSIINAIYTRIAVDCASVTMLHVKTDDKDRYSETITDSLNDCLTLEANTDQTGRSFIQNLTLALLDKGCVAIVVTDADRNPLMTDSYNILSMRVGEVKAWYPYEVLVDVYNERTGKHEEITVPKRICAIIENPFYSIMNEPNSTAQRLIRKLNMLDAVDEQSSSGKLDLIIQLPYVVRNEQKREQANKRRKEIEMQLTGSKYGIAYTDGTEKITQLNRAVENNLLNQIQYLTELLFNQLGVPIEVFNGTADEQTMLNYNNRTIEPIMSAIADEFKRKFLTKTARTKGHSIMFFKDPFKLVPVNQLAEIADKFTRNEIMTSNEIRQVVGLKPSDDPKADKLVNSNLNQSNEENSQEQVPTETNNAEEMIQKLGE